MSALQLATKQAIKQKKIHYNLFDKLWDAHLKITPSALKVRKLLHSAGETFVKTDHISLRSVGYKETGITRLANPFLQNGYEIKGSYNFSNKDMEAVHLAPTKALANQVNNLPKIFISQLNMDDYPYWFQAQFLSCIGSFANYNPHDVATWGAPWSKSYTQYEKIADISEYAAWFYTHGFVPNHFTVDVNELARFKDINTLNDFISDNGVKLHENGGVVKGGSDKKLLQSSSVADVVGVDFEGMAGRVRARAVPGGFNEFAQRETVSTGDKFDKFISTSAEQLFTSTDREHTEAENKAALLFKDTKIDCNKSETCNKS